MKQNSELTLESGQWLISKTLQWVTFVYFLCALPLICPCGLSVFECSDSPLEQQKKSGHSSASSSHPTAAAATKDVAGNGGRKAQIWRWIKVKAAGQGRRSIHAQCSRNAPPLLGEPRMNGPLYYNVLCAVRQQLRASLPPSAFIHGMQGGL